MGESPVPHPGYAACDAEFSKCMDSLHLNGE